LASPDRIRSFQIPTLPTVHNELSPGGLGPLDRDRKSEDWRIS